MRHAQLRAIGFLVAVWVLSALFSTVWEGAIREFQAPSLLTSPYSFTQELVIVLVVTLIGGTLVACFDVLVLSPLLLRRPLGATLVAKTAFYLTCIVGVISLAVLTTRRVRQGRPFGLSDVGASLADYWSTPESIATVVFWAFAVMFGLFVVQVGEKFGQGVLIAFLMGKYHRPKPEERIFMFLDLTSSTVFAERLGHQKYSQLLQDCFFDLSEAVVRHSAVVYQYVGDEAVLTWRTQAGLANANCIRVFAAFDEAIRARSDHYQTRYGMLPEFKAGVHVGPVTVAEVGGVKKELAFHGDVLNTASRIEGKCNELGCRLLVSERLAKLVADHGDYDFESVGEVELKGKALPVRVYGDPQWRVPERASPVIGLDAAEGEG